MREHKRWNRLDNAAKIFPPTTSRKDTKVFRFICELTEPVDGEILKQALEQTLIDFPLYRSILKKGLFWYYFEESNISPCVEEEAIPVCSPLYNEDKPGLLFRVFYWQYRINLEVFHALADGSGAIQFLRALIFYYLADKYAIPGHLTDYDASPQQKSQDAFYKYYDKTGIISKTDHKKAYRVRGELLPFNMLGVIESFTDTKAMFEKTHEHNATLSEFLIAQLICAIHGGMAVREESRPVVITVPVDLRRFFPAQTACNFFGVIRISHCFKKDGKSFNEVLNNVRESLRQQLTQEHLGSIISRYSAIENNLLIKLVPLQIKNWALALSGLRADSEDTAAFSNTGRISMPDSVSKYIRLFSVFLSTKRPQICLCSFADTLAISISSPFADTGIQRRFFRSLTDMGINVQVISNLEQINNEEMPNAAL